MLRGGGKILVVVGLATGALLPATPASADVLTVNVFNDHAPGACSPGDCTVREAIIAANVGSDHDTIVIPATKIALTIPGANENAAFTGDLDILHPVTIQGAGANRTSINGNGPITGDRIFDDLALGDVTFTGLEIRNGAAPAGQDGGAIRGSDLTLVDVSVSGSTAPGDGGGLVDYSVLSADRVTVWGNHAGELGGGIGLQTNGRLENVTVSGNESDGNGGGIAFGNQAIPGLVQATNLTVTANRADDDGIDGGNGGGLYQAGDTLFRIANSIVSGNTDATPGLTIRHHDCSGVISSQGYNLIRNQTGCTITDDTTGNLPAGTDPMLGALANNGGQTRTHALLAGSPAINAGSPAAPGSSTFACRVTDQRGVPRPIDGTCDLGPYELAKCFTVTVNRVGTPGNDTFIGTSASEVYLLLAGVDTVDAKGGNDYACGGTGNDILTGGDGDDHLAGEGGNDQIHGGVGFDECLGGSGTDSSTGCDLSSNIP